MSAYIKHIFTVSCPLPSWARKLGLAGFMFFLIKGLLWLIIPAILFKLGQ